MRSKHTDAFDAHLMLNLAGSDGLIADVTHVAGAFADPDLGSATGWKRGSDQFRENRNREISSGVVSVVVPPFGAPSNGQGALVNTLRGQATGEVRARPELHTTHSYCDLHHGAQGTRTSAS
jgi:hypothetical protein